MDFSLSPTAQSLSHKIQAFLDQHVLPQEALYYQQLGADNPNWREWKVPAIMETWKTKAREAGLWNLFLPPHDSGGLSNCDYAPLAEIMGHTPIAPEIFNCNAPDTGNMEVILKYGSAEQKERWLKPLLEGRIRSVFFMTEPGVASSDATNMQATCRVEGSDIILNGRKWWSSGVGHPACKFGIFMGVTDPNAPRHQRHSMVLVPLDAPGVKIERMLPVFHSYDAPYGHGEVSFTNVRLPLGMMIAGPGRGFEIAQGRLGPGRIHHCMRAIGAAERALHLLCRRASERVAFGKPLVELGGNRDIIAEARMRIDMARLLTHKAAWLMDTVGVQGAMSEISQIKVVVPNVAQDVIDQAIQIHGGAGLSDDFPLAALYAYARVLRIADGPDEVHRNLIAKLEWKRQGLA
ncbi:acyl-CoA dehydrogenase family protein [Oligoflexus tunisiensis]|uniref:acyl-CoA dehydrogenase family protein n=1 Tax=Oligoflexus tunisiensis TaxID=708132 RepID=UPI000B301131|nr:acyl-CoA dehydrogenase family protein [Oligoflexus tunisiensis]